MSVDNLETKIEFLDGKDKLYIKEYSTDAYDTIYLHTISCEEDLCTFLVKDGKTKIISKKLGDNDVVVDEFDKIDYFERHGNYLVAESNKNLIVYHYDNSWKKVLEEKNLGSIYKLPINGHLSLAFFNNNGYILISKDGVYKNRKIGEARLHITHDEKYLIKSQKRKILILENGLIEYE